MLFAVRLLDYEMRDGTDHHWHTDEGFRRYISLLVELGYEPSDIGREFLADWAKDVQEAEVPA